MNPAFNILLYLTISLINMSSSFFFRPRQPTRMMRKGSRSPWAQSLIST
jgi:hypothetical protein